MVWKEGLTLLFKHIGHIQCKGSVQFKLFPLTDWVRICICLWQNSSCNWRLGWLYIRNNRLTNWINVPHSFFLSFFISSFAVIILLLHNKVCNVLRGLQLQVQKWKLWRAFSQFRRVSSGNAAFVYSFSLSLSLFSFCHLKLSFLFLFIHLGNSSLSEHLFLPTQLEWIQYGDVNRCNFRLIIYCFFFLPPTKMNQSIESHSPYPSSAERHAGHE